MFGGRELQPSVKHCEGHICGSALVITSQSMQKSTCRSLIHPARPSGKHLIGQVFIFKRDPKQSTVSHGSASPVSDLNIITRTETETSTEELWMFFISPENCSWTLLKEIPESVQAVVIQTLTFRLVIIGICTSVHGLYFQIGLHVSINHLFSCWNVKKWAFGSRIWTNVIWSLIINDNYYYWNKH